jgi:PAS domain S-box-containing protein
MKRSPSSEQPVPERLLRKGYTAAQYQGLFENNTTGVVFVDNAGVITAVNRRLTRLLGRTKASLLGSPLIELCAESTRASAARRLDKAASEPRRRRTLELSLRHAKGQEVHTQAAPTFFRNASGRPAGGVVVFTDISAQKTAVQNLWQKSQFYEALFRDASVMILILDAQGVIRGVNRAAERISGYRADELRGKVVWNLYDLEPSQAELARERIEQLLSGEAEWIADPFRFRRKDGSICHAEAQTSILHRPDGSPDGFVTTAIDVTERMRLESELVRVVEDEQTRIGNDLHDGLGQMLAGAAAMLEVLNQGLEGRQRQDGERVYEILRETVREARRISHGLSPAAVRNRGLAGGLLLLAEHANAAGQIQCVTEIDTAVRAVDASQETHLYRIAQEALSNAIRHSKSDLVKITLARHDGDCVLEVRDRGIGFDPNGAKSDGIGLRVMRHRANIIGARLSIDSAPGWETVVRCWFRGGRAAKPGGGRRA